MADPIFRPQPDRRKAPRVGLHLVRYDDPTATSVRLQRTVCGKTVRPVEVALHNDAVTCPACRQWLTDYERLEF